MFAFTIYIYIFKVLNFWKNTSLLSEFIMVPCTWWQKNDDQSSSFHCTIVQFLIYLPAGYNYYGTERMYSGVDGREFEADIFFGVVYYQRLRHMVADKYQVIYSPPAHSSVLYLILVSLCIKTFPTSVWWQTIMRVIWLALTAVWRDFSQCFIG